MVDIFSHELRTPAGTAKNSIQMIQVMAGKPDLEKEEFMQKSKVYSDRAVENIRRLSNIITRMLNATKLDTNEMKLNIVDVDALGVVDDSYTNFIEKAKSKGLELQAMKPDFPVTIKADRDALQQIIDNLVDNAIKYTSQGSVNLSLEVFEDHVKYSVADTGIGIPAEEISKLGRKFYRVDNYIREGEGEDQVLRPDGTGIGLFVVKGLIQLMNGRLVIKSGGKGQGSVFEVYLPR